MDIDLNKPVTLQISTGTYFCLVCLAKGFNLLNDQGEPDPVQLLDALAHGKILIQLQPDPPLGTPRWVWFNRSEHSEE